MLILAFCEFIMSRGRSFTPEEVEIVLAFKAECLIPGSIVDRIGRSRTDVRNVFSKQKRLMKRSNVRRPPKLTYCTSLAIVFREKHGQYSDRQLRDTFNAPVSAVRVQNLLHDAASFTNPSVMSAPALTILRKKESTEWVRQLLTSNHSFWKSIVLSDENALIFMPWKFVLLTGPTILLKIATCLAGYMVAVI